MQLRKFYGRTIGAALAQVKRELGPDALILETNPITPEHYAARTNPDAKYEILAAREVRSGRSQKPEVRSQKVEAGNSRIQELKNSRIQEYKNSEMLGKANGQSLASLALNNSEKAAPRSIHNGQTEALHAANHGRDARATKNPQSEQTPDLLEDLGLLRRQISELLDGDLSGAPKGAGRLDIRDYYSLLEQGVNHETLAPHFRSWLEWRTVPPAYRTYLAQIHEDGPAASMQGESLREWLWLTWCERSLGEGMRNAECGMRNAEFKKSRIQESRKSEGPRVLALVGACGSGKTTTLAKMASINSHLNRQNAVILTLDTFRFGATEQWRRMARLMGIEVEEVVSQTELSASIERWGQYDWIGIDTPGGLNSDTAAGMLYGSILAQYPAMESVLVLPATQQESVSRDQMRRYRSLGARKVLFSRLDESMHNGGIINLTMDGNWKIDSFATGSRIPEDWEDASREILWRRVAAPPTLGGVAA